jgi:hypothetical protein
MLARPSTSPTVAGAAQRAAVARPNRNRRPGRAPRRVARREYDQPRLEYTRLSREAGRSWPGVGAMSRSGHKQVGRACATTPLYRVRPCARQAAGWPRGVSRSRMHGLIHNGLRPARNEAHARKPHGRACIRSLNPPGSREVRYRMLKLPPQSHVGAAAPIRGGSSSVWSRAAAFQVVGRGFESHLPLRFACRVLPLHQPGEAARSIPILRSKRLAPTHRGTPRRARRLAKSCRKT